MDINLLLIIMTAMVCYIYVHVFINMYVYLRICCVLDILNCIINNHNCSQKCVEVVGSFNCSCYPGYKLQEDEVNCIGMLNSICKYVCMYVQV